MIISHKHRFIFIKTGKTAGTSIETYLSPFCGKDDVLTPFGIEEKGHQPRNFSGFKNHMPGHKIRSIIPEPVWQNHFKFCVERNPWDKALSHYHFINKRQALNITFDEYLAGGYNCLNFHMYTEPLNPNKIIVDRILRYENLSEELSEVFDRFKIPFVEDLGVRAKGQYRTDRRPYREVLTNKQKGIIAKKYKQEIQLFNYRY